MTTNILINDQLIESNIDADMLTIVLPVDAYTIETLDDGSYTYKMDESTYDYLIAVQDGEDDLKKYPSDLVEQAREKFEGCAEHPFDLINKMIAYLDGK